LKAVEVGDAVAEFDRCWNARGVTRFELPEVDVNDILAKRYRLTPNVRLTRSAIWDMACKKALDPVTYVPDVISQAGRLSARQLKPGAEHFVRWSIQKAWLGEQRGRVIESIFLDHNAQKIIFLGQAEARAEDGTSTLAVDYQPLAHVEHSAGGTEQDPCHVWKIVFLTKTRDDRYIRSFKEMATAGRLPRYLEIYIEKDLGVQILNCPGRG